MSLLSEKAKAEVIDFFEMQADFLNDRKIHLDLGLSSQDFFREVVRPLRNFLKEAMGRDLVPPLKNSSNMIPCAIVIPEEGMHINNQYIKLGLGTLKDPKIENRIKFDYYQREQLLTIGAWPYLAVAVQIVAAPHTTSGFLGDIDAALGEKKIMFGLDGLMSVLTLNALDNRMVPWNNNTGRGEVALGASAKQDGDRITYPVVEFDNAWGIIIRHFTSDKTKKASPNHRFLICGGRFRVQH